MMSRKEEYSQWAEQQEKLPIFMQPWWMDAVCAGKDWDVLLSKNARGEIMAAMPYLYREKWGFKWIVMPQQTSIGGIWFVQNGGMIDNTDEAIDIRAICEDFAQQLKSLGISYYQQNFPINNRAIPILKANRFKTQQRVTYQIKDLHDLEQVINAFSKNKKRQISKASHLEVRHSMSAEEFYRLHSGFLRRQHKQISYSREFLLVLDRKARRHQQAEVISIHDHEGCPYAAVYLVWDSSTMYYLIPCYDPIHKDSGAGALLAQEAIKLAHEKGVKFDFEGSMNPGIANHYSQFGSQPVTYYSVFRLYNPLFALALLWNKIQEKKYGFRR